MSGRLGLGNGALSTYALRPRSTGALAALPMVGAEGGSDRSGAHRRETLPEGKTFE